MNTTTSTADFCFRQNMLISHEHPSLNGHFPNNPIVPGVVILDQVMRLWQEKTTKQIRQINHAKFVHLLPADIPCTIEYQRSEYQDSQDKNSLYIKKRTNKINFLILDDKQSIIAKGQFSYEQ